jgi:hypothetical protein
MFLVLFLKKNKTETIGKSLAELMFLVLFLKRTRWKPRVKPRRATVFGSFLKKNNTGLELKARRANVFKGHFKALISSVRRHECVGGVVTGENRVLR